MNKLFVVLSAAALTTGATLVFAAERADSLTEARPGTPATIFEAHPVNGMMKMNDMDMNAMDANSDGMLAKDEFIAQQALNYEYMKKNAGMVDMADMTMMQGHDAARCFH